ncbi:imidazole glycerol phosphate synthase subunit HisF [Kurthia sibirica]|uniref:Imidazole glycerol phosphate synthase subunit HisF n=1 Tax=Kurthia sibirica TaxID=202750 RepID=A0A2U3AJ93_9BACL|nr:imidazole glycerol phosphate synthase subunit HisF [Kurthia sibirica]PWI24619.1 imidazole glycerol phosphate synthase subunit HisF [Kurthia sibirica]GEK33447.1 imidazole glycerol phosphate synthase subunit HisF [Kurthia sibirica]
MLKKRIIPCLDVKEGRVVKGVQFVSLRDAGDPVELATFYNEQGADELVFLDISATVEGRDTMEDVVRQTASTLSIPFTVGGGIRTLEDMKRMLRAGADKVSLNSAALQNPSIIKEGADYFGSQCIVVAIDAKWSAEEDTWMIYTHGGRNRFERSAIEWAQQVAALGAGELLVTSMDGDGKKTGFDIALMTALRKVVNIPLIASGGAGNAEHFYEVFTEADADAALAASIFHYKETSVQQVKDYLRNQGVAIR